MPHLEDAQCPHNSVHRWRCAHCAGVCCDDHCGSAAAVFEGKIDFVNPKTGFVNPQRFMRCKGCHEAYKDRQLTKGRWASKIDRRRGSFW